MNFLNLLPIYSSVSDEGCAGGCKGGCRACEGCDGCRDTAKVTGPSPDPIAL